MKKKLFLIAITISLLVGCGKVTPTNTAQQNGQPPLEATTSNSLVSKSTTPTTATVDVTQDSKTIVPSLTAETKNQPYSITTATFCKDNIKIEYPQIKGVDDKAKEKVINDLIKSDLLKNEVEEPINSYGKGTLTMNWNYQVTMNTPDLLSVIYTGNSKMEGAAYPTNNIYAITIDLNNVKKLKLSDFTVIDTYLAQKIKQSTAVTNEAVKKGMDKNVLIAVVQSVDDQTLIKGLKEEWAYNTFYVTPNYLVVSVDVAHAIGDYALVELPGQYTKR